MIVCIEYILRKMICCPCGSERGMKAVCPKASESQFRCGFKRQCSVSTLDHTTVSLSGKSPGITRSGGKGRLRQTGTSLCYGEQPTGSPIPEVTNEDLQWIPPDKYWDFWGWRQFPNLAVICCEPVWQAREAWVHVLRILKCLDWDTAPYWQDCWCTRWAVCSPPRVLPANKKRVKSSQWGSDILTYSNTCI